MKRDLYVEVANRIIAELETGAAPWVKPWKPVAGGNTPVNATTGRPYSGCNVILLWMTTTANGWARPRFLTFKQALDVGGHVRKGEHGTKVYFVSTFEKKREDEDEAKRIPFLKEYTVFNVAQCDDLPAKVIEGEAGTVKTVAERNAEADDFISITGADVREGNGEAYFVPSRDFISMPAFAAFKSVDHFYGTVFHELGHWTGHKSRLDRDLSGRFGNAAYAAEELIAELTAAFICAEFGFEGELRHAGYIATWITLLKDDPRAFFTAASKAQKAADYLRSLALAEPEKIAA